MPIPTSILVYGRMDENYSSLLEPPPLKRAGRCLPIEILSCVLWDIIVLVATTLRVSPTNIGLGPAFTWNLSLKRNLGGEVGGVECAAGGEETRAIHLRQNQRVDDIW